MADDDMRHKQGEVRGNAAEIAVPEMKLTTRGQILRGIVVDPQGQPLAGIMVTSRLSIGRPIQTLGKTSRNWMTTDAQGRFEIRQLPDKPVELMAYRPNPKGGPIRHPGIAHPTLNQKDVRIVLDPTLGDEIEDLDTPKPPGNKKP
jgi:hypothetical protein